jgi:hypothetical protein
MKSMACVTSILVLYANLSRMTLLIIFFLTLASKADIGSSIKYISLSEYTALARLILAFYPPLKLIPFSPISVRSPAGSKVRSLCRSHDLIV